MGKAANRKRDQQSAPTGILHDRIQAEAKKAKDAPRHTMRDAEETPALAILLEGAREALGKAVPAQFELDGKTYWLRCSIGLARFEVFDSAASATPLVTGVSGSYEKYAYRNPTDHERSRCFLTLQP